MPPTNASPFAGAFASLQTAHNRVTGTRKQVRIGRELYDAIVEPVTGAEVYVAGGNAESGGFKVMVACSLFAKRPKELIPVQVPGERELQVLSVNTVNGVTYELTCGDPTTDQRA